MAIKEVIKEYYKQLNMHRFGNLVEMDQLSGNYSLPKLTKKK